MNIKHFTTIAALAATLSTVACEEAEPVALAPAATALKDAKPKSAAAQIFTIDSTTAAVEFEMDAPQEKIRGRVPGSMTGTIQIDLSDITKTTAKLVVDIDALELFQRRLDDDGEFGEEVKQETQNEHARTWLEISDDAPEDVRRTNSRVEFVIKRITATSDKDVTKMTGAERRVAFTVVGDLLLHGRKSEKSVALTAMFAFDGDRARSVRIETARAFEVDLAEHDVRPRQAFGKLAAKTLSVLSPKVAKSASTSLRFTAVLNGDGDS